MKKEKNKKKNLYQVLVIICAVAFLVYAYAFYISLKLHDTFKIYFDGIVAFIWCFCAIGWFLLLKRINNRENQQDDK